MKFRNLPFGMLSAGGVSLAMAGEVKWDGSCDQNWHTCCSIGGGIFENNWKFGPGPSCPPLPGPSDDVDLGPGIVVLTQAPETIQSLLSTGAFVINGVDLTVSGGAFLSNFNLTGGGLHTGGQIVVSGELNWTAGEMSHLGGPPVSTQLLGPLTVSANGAKLTGRQTQCANSIAWLGGNITLGDGTTLDNQADCVVQCDKIMQFGGGAGAKFINSGSFSKQTTAGQTLISKDIAFDSPGTIQVQSGTLRIESASGSSSGMFSIDPNALLQFAQFGAGSFTLQNGTIFGGGGWTKSTSANLIIPAGVNVNASNFELAGGKLVGPGKLTPQFLRWTLGSIDHSHVNPFQTLELSGNLAKTLVGGDGQGLLDNAGSATWMGNGGIIFTKDPAATVGPTLFNASGGTFEIRNDQTLTGAGQVVNAGILRKKDSPGMTQFLGSVALQNDGTLDIQSGTVRLEAGGTNTGNITVAPGAALNVKFGTFEFLTDTDITGGGLFWQEGGTTQAGNAITVTPDNLRVSGGKLLGQGAWLPKNMEWTGGSLEGGGAASPENLAIDGFLGKSLDNYELISREFTTWDGTGLFALQNGSVFTNDGAMQIVDEAKEVRFYNSQWKNATGSLLNILTNVEFGPVGTNGTFTNSPDSIVNIGPGATTVDFQTIVPVINAGTFNVNTGTLYLRAGQSSSGAVFDNASGGATEFRSGPFTATSTEFRGAGLTRIGLGGTLQVEGETTATNVALSAAGAKVNGAGKLTVSDSLTWTDGSMAGTGTTETAASASMKMIGTAQKTLSGRLFSNKGMASLSGGTFLLNDGAVFRNEPGGIVEVQPDFDFDSTNGAEGVFDNRGILRTVPGDRGGAVRFLNNVRFNNHDTVNVLSGDLEIRGGGTSDGLFAVAAGSVVDFHTGSELGGYTLETGARVQGTGTARVTRAVKIAGDVEMTNLELASLVKGIDGPGVLTITGTLDWIDGYVEGPPTGIMRVDGTAKIVPDGSGASNHRLDERVLILAGTTNVEAGAVSPQLRLRNGAKVVIDTEGKFDANAAGIPIVVDHVDGAAGNVFNFGTVNVKGSSWLEFDPNVAFDNDGTVNLMDATELRVQGGGSSTGTFNLPSTNNVVRFQSNYAWNDGTKFVGPGLCSVSATSVVAVTGDVSADRLSLDGTLDGPGTLSVNTFFNCSQGTMKGSGRTISSGGAQVSGTLDARVLENQGTMSVFGTLSLSNKATIENSGAFVLSTGTPILTGPDDVGFKNSGTLTNEVNVGKEGRVEIPFTNSGGTVVNKSGILRFTKFYAQTAGSTLVAKDLIIFAQPPFIAAGSKIEGSDRIVAPKVQSSGSVGPGQSPGKLTFEADYVQEADGVLEIELGGLNPGIDHDVLEVTGAATLDGTLDVIMLPGFVPGPGDTFPFLTAGSITGSFSNAPKGAGGVGKLTLPSGTFDVNYGPTSITLSNFAAKAPCTGDLNGDNQVGQADLGILLAAYNTCPGDPGYNAAAGMLAPEDPCVGQGDLGVLLANYGVVCP